MYVLLIICVYCSLFLCLPKAHGEASFVHIWHLSRTRIVEPLTSDAIGTLAIEALIEGERFDCKHECVLHHQYMSQAARLQ